MPMCKQCKEVFGVIDMQDGFCKSCYTPELAAEEKERIEQNKVDRPLLITLITFPHLLLGSLLLLDMIFILFKGSITKAIAIGGIGMLIILPYYGLYKMKKWGAYLVILLGIVSLISTFFDAGDIKIADGSFLQVFMVLMLLQLGAIATVVYYFKKMK